jgi:inhibitor of KinA
MTQFSFEIKPLGESALIVEFGNEISVDINDRAIALADELKANPFAGFIEAVPAYSSTAVFYDLVTVQNNYRGHPTAFQSVSRIAKKHIRISAPRPVSPAEVVNIPTSFTAAVGPDLESVAIACGVTVNALIDIFTQRTYRVYMIGFLPGFAYMGEVDERIRMPRRPQPRRRVPEGSVGIAGAQTGVYPVETPGGWQIIGQTEVKLFTPESPDPSLLKPGDLVRFSPL